MSNVSRRSFVELTVGSLMALPALAGGLIVAPSSALADENPDVTVSVGEPEVRNYAIIDVVRPWEVGFIVRDVTRVIRTATDDEENERVQGTAHVIVTSRANGKSVSGDTNDDGIVNLDIKALAEDPDHVGTDKLKEWNFNATIQVSCDGYRTFETALVRVSGGFGLIVPMHPIDFDGPYPHRVSFDEWDALYTKNEFLLAAGNTGDHTIQVVMHNVTSADQAAIQLWVDGESTPRQSVRVSPDTAGKVVTATLKGPFLKKGDPQALPVGASYRISMTQGTATYSWPVSFALFEGVFDAPSSKEKVTLKPFDTSGSSGTKFDIKWPSGVPLVGNGSLNFWTPSLPIDIYVNPFGYIQLTGRRRQASQIAVLESPPLEARSDLPRPCIQSRTRQYAVCRLP